MYGVRGKVIHIITVMNVMINASIVDDYSVSSDVIIGSSTTAALIVVIILATVSILGIVKLCRAAIQKYKTAQLQK